MSRLNPDISDVVLYALFYILPITFSICLLWLIINSIKYSSDKPESLSWGKSVQAIIMWSSLGGFICICLYYKYKYK